MCMFLSDVQYSPPNWIHEAFRCHGVDCVVLSRHFVSCSVLSCHAISFVVSCRVMSCCVISCRVVSCHVDGRHGWYVTSRVNTSPRVMSLCVASLLVTSCHVLSYFVVVSSSLVTSLRDGSCHVTTFHMAWCHAASPDDTTRQEVSCHLVSNPRLDSPTGPQRDSVINALTSKSKFQNVDFAIWKQQSRCKESSLKSF